MKTYKGIFKPTNPKKYVGDDSNIIYRSRWELKAMTYFDTHPDIIRWASEEIAIKYISPKDLKPHRYFPDFLIECKTKNGLEKFLIEVKPKAQTVPPKPSKNKKRFINETVTYAVNTAKWNAAKLWCEKHNVKFVIMTEHELGIKF